MKHRIPSFFLLLAAVLFFTPVTHAETSTPLDALRLKFSNLPEKTRTEYSTKLIKAQNLFNQKRIFDTLQKIDELDKIFPDHPNALNLKGACYVELRNFEKASAIFKKVIRIAPDNVNVQFNLAEVDFVTKNWQSARDRFQKIIPLLKRNKPMLRLCEFKLLLCNLKLGKVKEAIAIKDSHDAWDDSPFHYYATAAILYHSGKKKEAEKSLRDARYIWKNDKALSAWQDTMIEYGYVRSFYGNDADLQNEAITPEN